MWIDLWSRTYNRYRTTPALLLLRIPVSHQAGVLQLVSEIKMTDFRYFLKNFMYEFLTLWLFS